MIVNMQSGGVVPERILDAQTITPSTVNKVFEEGTYLRGALTILGDADLVAESIPRDVNIFGVQGTRQPDYGPNVWKKSDLKVQTCRVYATVQSWSKWGGIVFKINLDGDASIFTFDSLVGKELGRYINPNNTSNVYAHVVSSITSSTRKTYKDGTYQSDYNDDAEWDDSALTYTVKIGGLDSQPDIYNLMDFTITKETELSATFIVNDDPSAYPDSAYHTDGYYYELLGSVSSANVMSLSDNAVATVQQDYRDTVGEDVSNANA